MEISYNDIDILRALAEQYAAFASLSVQKETIENWKQLNSLHPVKPMVLIDQIPWHEMNVNDELTLRCEDEFCRGLEWKLRNTLYRWQHFSCDMVVMPYIEIPKAIASSGYGIETKADATVAEFHPGAESQIYADQITDMDKLEKIQYHTITHDENVTMQRKHAAESIFGGILPVRMTGAVPEFTVWDRLAFFRGVTPILYDFADRPKFLHAVMEKFTAIQLNILRQYEELDVLDLDVATIHCTATFNNELPHMDFNGESVRAKDCWAFGMGQIFSSCSPALFDEFEIEYAKRYYDKCGLVYYGCCEPLHNVIHLIRKIKNVRKISCSPWADVNIMTKNIGDDYVLVRKPNPAYVAGDDLDERSIRKEITETLKACKDNGTPCEFILKDISTVRHHPERLTRWAEIAREEIERFDS